MSDKKEDMEKNKEQDSENYAPINWAWEFLKRNSDYSDRISRGKLNYDTKNN